MNHRSSKQPALVFATAALTVLLMAVVVIGALVASAILDPLPTGGGQRYSGGNAEWDPVIGYAPPRNGVLLRDPRNRKGKKAYIYTDSRRARVSRQGDETPDQVDLVTVGGSFSRGGGMKNEETFTQLVAREFAMTAANFAMGGYGTVQSLLALERNLDLNPRFIVYPLIEDHMRRNHAPCAAAALPFCFPRAYFAIDDGKPSIHPPHEAYRQPELVARYQKDIGLKKGKVGIGHILWKARFAFLGWSYYLQSNVAYPTDAESFRASMDYLIGRMHDDAVQAGARLVVVYLPSLRRNEQNPPPESLLSAVEARAGDGLLFLDLSGPVAAYYEEPGARRLHFKDDGHPDKHGHAFIANHLTEALRPYVEAQ